MSETRHDRDYVRPDWKPQTGTVEGTVSAGDKLGRPYATSPKVRRKKTDDVKVGRAEESVMEDRRLKEISPGRWIEDREQDG